jgi:DNA-binding NarL/FixJ family response regulator
MNPVRVVIADDHPLFRRGLVDAIERAAGIALAGESDNGDDAWRLIQDVRPDVAVLDVEMPGAGALSILKKLAESGLPTRVIVLTMHRDPEIFNAAIDSGATGYLLKDAAGMEIATAIRSAASGTPYISASLSSALLERSQRTSALMKGKPELQKLTPTERKVLKCISLGRTSKEVAHDLGVSFRTVENHRTNICGKLGLSGTNALLRFALEHRSEL